MKILVSLTLSIFLATNALAATLIERFNSSDRLSHGAIVSYENKDADRVVPANLNTMDRLSGVVVDDAKIDLFQLQNDGRDITTVSSGVADILVTDLNGAIKSGDLLAPSQISGVASRQSGQARLVATAIEGYTGMDDPNMLTTVVDDSFEQEVSVGRIAARIDLRENPYSEQYTPRAPGFIQNFADSISGSDVSSVRTLAAVIVAAISLVFALGLFITMQASVSRSSSRNPTSKDTLIKSERQLLLIVGAVLVVGLLLAYFILRTE